MSIAIFDENERWTPEAKAAVQRFEDVMKPVFDELVAEGFNPRELSWLMIDQVRVHEIYTRYAARSAKYDSTKYDKENDVAVEG